MSTIDFVTNDNANEPHVAVTVDGIKVAEFPIIEGGINRAEEYADAFITHVLLRKKQCF